MRVDRKCSKHRTAQAPKPLAVSLRTNIPVDKKHMDKEIEYGFWFWSDKLAGVLTMLSHLTDYKLDQEEIEFVKQELRGTNDEKNQWATYKLDGKANKMALAFAYDSEEGTDMIHIKIKTSADLKPKLEALDLFQCLFKQLDIADT